MKRNAIVPLFAMVLFGTTTALYISLRSPLNGDDHLDESEQEYLLERLENEVFTDGRVNMDALRVFITTLPKPSKVYTWNKAGYNNTIPQLVMIVFKDRFSEKEKHEYDKMVESISKDSSE